MAKFFLGKEYVPHCVGKIVGGMLIGAIGGSLGLFLGFSFFDVICKCLDNLIMPLVNYFISSGVVEDQSTTLT